MNKISVVINTYNAGKYLAECLEAVKTFNEIVVCDMESTDNTVEIARQYGCKVVTFPKANHKSAEPARTFAIQSASYDWVLVVDCDEIVTPELREYLYQHIQKPNCADGLYIPRMNYELNTFFKGTYPDHQLRFFRKEGTTWPPYVHTIPDVKGVKEKIPANRMELAFRHMSVTMSDTINKLNQYTDNEVEKKKGKKASLLKMIFSPMVRFLKVYIAKGGFKYGRLGFIIAQQQAMYKFTILAKMYEKEMEEKNKKANS